MHRVQVIDSHAGGEPTRLVISGGPNLGRGSVAEQLRCFREQHDAFRSAVVNEPRGSDVLVGAMLVPPADPSCTLGVIFFNNVGFLGMCGHGTIGFIVTLAHLGRIGPGEHRIETSVGIVTATLHADGSVSVRNVPAHRKSAGVRVTVPGLGDVVGDVAWSGNWFYLVGQPAWPLELRQVEFLTDITWRIRQAVNAQGYPEVDHVELFGPAGTPAGDSRNFVLCPGKAYDRSPCGTGSCAKIACLAADGHLAPGAIWQQASVIGSRFQVSYEMVDGQIIPTVRGRAYVSAESHLVLDPQDPFCWGIRL